jgi:uncharacterized protein (DUF1778 family)
MKEQNKDTQLLLRMTKEEKKILKKLANKENRTMTGYLINLIHKMKEREQKLAPVDN